jgi:hypothetical protein
MVRALGNAVLRALVIVGATVGALVALKLALLINSSSNYTGPDPNHVATVDLHVDLEAQGRLIGYFRRFSADNGFDFDLRDSAEGAHFFTIGMVRKGRIRDIGILVGAPFFNPHEIEVSVIQNDDDPATPPRVDALAASIEKTIGDVPGVRLQPVTGDTSEGTPRTLR